MVPIVQPQCASRSKEGVPIEKVPLNRFDVDIVWCAETNCPTVTYPNHTSARRLLRVENIVLTSNTPGRRVREVKYVGETWASSGKRRNSKLESCRMIFRPRPVGTSSTGNRYLCVHCPAAHDASRHDGIATHHTDLIANRCGFVHFSV